MTNRELEGRKIRLVDFPGEEFTLTYAGWDDEWIVKNRWGVDMMRVSGSEAIPYLIAPEQERHQWSYTPQEPPQPLYKGYIMDKVRQHLGLETYDNSRDMDINGMTHDSILDHCLEWEGIIGYGNSIRGWVEEIYGIVLE